MNSLCPLQPTDDIVLMALALEKIYVQKIAQMPQREVEIVPHAAKAKGKKTTQGNSPKRTGNSTSCCFICSKHQVTSRSHLRLGCMNTQ